MPHSPRWLMFTSGHHATIMEAAGAGAVAPTSGCLLVIAHALSAWGDKDVTAAIAAVKAAELALSEAKAAADRLVLRKFEGDIQTACLEAKTAAAVAPAPARVPLDDIGEMADDAMAAAARARGPLYKQAASMRPDLVYLGDAGSLDMWIVGPGIESVADTEFVFVNSRGAVWSIERSQMNARLHAHHQQALALVLSYRRSQTVAERALKTFAKIAEGPWAPAKAAREPF